MRIGDDSEYYPATEPVGPLYEYERPPDTQNEMAGAYGGRSAASLDPDHLELIMDTCRICDALVTITGLVWDLREERWRPLVVCDADHETVVD